MVHESYHAPPALSTADGQVAAAAVPPSDTAVGLNRPTLK